MLKKILFFLLIFNVIFSHTLKNYRTDVFVGKNRKILIVETSDILLENDVNIRVIQDMLGHKELRTTLIYAKIIDKKRREAASIFDTEFKK